MRLNVENMWNMRIQFTCNNEISIDTENEGLDEQTDERTSGQTDE